MYTRILRFESINHNKRESINNVKSLCITQKCLIAFGLKSILSNRYFQG